MTGHDGMNVGVRLDQLDERLALIARELAEVRAFVSSQEPEGTTSPAEPDVGEARVGAITDATRRGAVRPPTPSPAVTRVPTPAPPPAPRPETRPAAARPPAASRPEPPAAPPKPPRRSLGQLARDWDLVGARGFAIAGGAVMALGIGFFFVLAANRGWIDERARVALGATASALAFGAGLLLRSRYGQYWSALAAVGAGIAGAYATLAAAAARYDLVPDALALPLAGAIAAVATFVALRWKSEVIAAIGLLGAALAPALQSVDTAMTWESAAFAAIVLVAAAAVCVTRDWVVLLVASSVLVGLQIEWLVFDEPSPPAPGPVTVAAVFTLTLLGIAVGRRIAGREEELDALALGYATVAFGVTLGLTSQLFADGTDRGTAFLAAGAVWAVVFAALQLARFADLGFVVAIGALALAAIGTAGLLGGTALTVVWAAESIALTVTAWRLGDARLRIAGIAYAALAAAQALVADAPLRILFDELGAQREAVLPLATVAAAAAAAGLLVPSEYVRRTETGLLRFVRDIRRGLVRHRVGIGEALAVGAAAFATLAAAFGLVAASFDWGHVTASALAAAVGALLLGIAGEQRSLGLAVASYTWLGVVLAEAVAFDVDAFYEDVAGLSVGGWSVAAAAAGLVGGAYAHRLLHRERGYADVLFGIVAGIAGLAASIAVAVVAETLRGSGAGLLVIALVYGALAAGIFGREGFRNASTILWSIGLVFLVGAEAALVTDDVWRTAVIALTGLAAGALSQPLREMRLWLAGGALVVATTAVGLLAQVQPWSAEGEIEQRLALVAGSCAVAAFGLAALVWGEARWRDPATVLWSIGILSLLSTERALIDDWRRTAFAAALTSAVLALLARPLREVRLWSAGVFVAAATTAGTIIVLTPFSHFFTASASPAGGLWVLAACVLALAVAAATTPDAESRLALASIAGVLALYALSLGILEVAVRVSGGSFETGFERGHTAVSGLWALLGLTLLVVGLVRGSAAVRYAGLALFGLSLAKIFVYDLAELSSVARAFSFILVGGLLLAGGFFLQRLSDRLGPPRPPGAPTASA
ncbi:MAG: DUF2339 domain-containing protein [Gaiellaceae bacterium]